MDNTLTIEEVQSLFNAGCDYSCFYHCTMNGKQKPSCLKKDVVQNCANCKYLNVRISHEPCASCNVLDFNRGITNIKSNWEAKQ